MLASGFSVVTLCAGLLLFGASVGNLLMLQPLILAEYRCAGVRENFLSQQSYVLDGDCHWAGPAWVCLCGQ